MTQYELKKLFTRQSPKKIISRTNKLHSTLQCHIWGELWEED